ncbi:hypothetical protein BTE48_00995 [Oceanospirillum multiglobuliferum]|uniref:Peptidase S24/S26A/S26B/S26C domain-containing protein n=1 Tax=Oceanospirillum multiglobuliferum TaxID=64969 RepID=A0A1V4T976_9GAMM|nr:hypothetical protein BTE48_00995 [Oceanospirillum multiglobuliferum]
MLSNRIRQCAEIAGSGDALSRLTAIPRRTLEMYLSGDAEPKAVRIGLIAKAAGVSGHWLLTGEGEIFESDKTGASELEEEFALVPGYNIQVSAGHGAFPDAFETPTRKLAFRHKWLRFRGLHVKDLVLVFAKGDSMEPTISDNNTLLIDTSQRDLQDGNIYVIRTDGHLIVKRVQQLWNKGILLISDNASYKEQQLSPEEVKELQVVGKVVWIGKDL